jgi:GNAT superfamily N-acetyltransferase
MPEFELRAVESETVPAVAALARMVDPWWVNTDEGIAHWLRFEPAATSRWLAAWRSGRCVGFAHARLASGVDGLTVGHLRGAVEPEARALGCGSALATAALRFMAEAGATIVQASSRDDAGAAFLAAREFRVTRAMHCSAVVLDRSTQTCAAAGMETISIAHLPARAIFDLHSAINRDVPTDHVANQLEFQHWERGWFASPELDLECSTAVCLEGRPVAAAFLIVDRLRRTAANDLSGTLPDLRRRGLARAAKSACLARAQLAGIELVYTANDETNIGILHLNRQLGYRQVGTEQIWERALSG